MDEEIKQQAEALDITPDELGQDAGRLPGQVPELDAKDAAAAQPKKPDEKEPPVRNSFPVPEGTPDLLAKAFRTIPAEAVQQYKQLYDSFNNQDMPFLEFACELAYISDPAIARRDLGRITASRQAFNIQKHQIDKQLASSGLN